MAIFTYSINIKSEEQKVKATMVLDQVQNIYSFRIDEQENTLLIVTTGGLSSKEIIKLLKDAGLESILIE